MIRQLVTAVREEFFLCISAGTSVIFLVFGPVVTGALSAPVVTGGPAGLAVLFAWLLFGACILLIFQS
jgi:hypothetical protein